MANAYVLESSEAVYVDMASEFWDHLASFSVYKILSF